MRTILPLAFLVSTFSLHAQTTPRIFCGNELFQSMVTEHYPDLDAAFRQTFEQARQPMAGIRTELTVPVVVHVVWKAAEENLPDSVIQAQIDVLNADYNRMNADTANLRTMFQGVAGNAEIHFELVATERIQTSKTFSIDILSGNLIPEVKHTVQGGSDGWDPDHYLNIWVCNIQPIKIGPIVVGQILGFAFPPNGLGHWPDGSSAPTPEEDGVVIDYRAFGPDNPYPIEIPGGTGNLVVKGRTPTHEVGHYLGLRHIWGDGSSFGPNDCAQSDGVDDTPFAAMESSFDCDITKNSCTGIEPFFGLDMPDLIENFMDYASEDCMNMFTKGQVEIMRNVLMGPRSGLLETTSTGDPDPAFTQIGVQPNPVRTGQTVTISSPGPDESRFLLIDLQGRTVRTTVKPRDMMSTTLDVHGLLPGMYILVRDLKGLRSASRLVVLP